MADVLHLARGLGKERFYRSSRGLDHGVGHPICLCVRL